jgi:serine/threonine protein kinase
MYCIGIALHVLYRYGTACRRMYCIGIALHVLTLTIHTHCTLTIQVFEGTFCGSTQVAIKELLNIRDARAFYDEMKILKQLRHPHIVTLYGVSMIYNKKQALEQVLHCTNTHTVLTHTVLAHTVLTHTVLAHTIHSLYSIY